MKKLYKLINWTAKVTLFTWLLFISTSANADHVVGSDISWKCTTTPGVFEVTLVIFRDCQGIPLCFGGGCGSGCSQSMNLRGADPSCNNTSYGSFSLQLVSVRDAAPEVDCPTAKSICNNMGCVTAGTFTPAIERYEFKGFMNVGATSGIPATCCNVKITWEMCCRNNGINTGASWQNFYVESTINRCHSVNPCNNSPVLSNDPIAFICGGEEFIFNNGATDPEFDSLTYAFTPSLQGAGSSVTYTPPYAFDRPMPWTGSATAEFPAGIRCLSDNGDIMFTPGNTSGNNFTGVVMAIEIKQWKIINGVPTVLSTTRRDVQMVVLGSCPNNNSPRLRTNPASLVSPNAPRTNWQVCAGDQLCFTVTAKDTDFFPPT
ncbi:MAG: hypothetical protein MUE96_12280, partial [Bacteroidia bacterium]|nr:hypothetical protein [Bacteroidia bacterium]